MPAAAPAATKYSMDLEGYRHLVRWGLRFGPWAREDAPEKIDAMVKFLESLTQAEANIWIDLGWVRVSNHVGQLNDGMPF